MSALLDSLAAAMAAIPGVEETITNALDRPSKDSVVVVEFVGEVPSPPRELPVTSVALGQKVAIAFHVAVGRNKGDADAARDLAMDLSRKGRLALEKDNKLGGLVEAMELGATRFNYAAWHGADYAVAQLDVAVLTEEELS
jgi:hypothetical protein